MAGKNQPAKQQQIHRSALVMYSARQMYDLVNDVASYPTFMSGCCAVDILESSPGYMMVRLCLAKAGLSYNLVTRNTLQPGQRIDLQLHEGPFEYLCGSWLFTPLREDACKVEMKLEFATVGRLKGRAMAVLFNQVAGSMVDVFCQQAGQIYGPA